MVVYIYKMEDINKTSSSIKNWAADDRPREKLFTKGAASLSDSELLAILINNGHKEKSAVDLAKEIMKLGNNNLNELGKLSIAAFQKIKGIERTETFISLDESFSRTVALAQTKK